MKTEIHMFDHDIVSVLTFTLVIIYYLWQLVHQPSKDAIHALNVIPK